MSLLPNKYRKGNSCNYEKSFETYVLNTYNLNTYQTVLPFIKEVSQLRNMVGNQAFPKTKEDFSKQIGLLVSYLAYLDSISSLVPFGKLKTQMSLSFSWTEVTTEKTTTSNSIDYEICSVKYNLAVALCSRAELNKKSQVDVELKEAMKDYQRAAGVLSEIKELHAKGLVKEGIPDFSQSYIEMNINYCLGMGNKCIYDICIIKGFNDEIKSKMAMGAHYYFNKAASTTISVPFDKAYYTHMSNLYKGLAYYHFYLSSINQVIGKGKGMGLMIGFLQGAQQLLNDSLKDQNTIKFIINSDLVTNTSSHLGIKIIEENARNDKYFYNESIIPLQSLPEIDMDLSKIKAIPNDEPGSTTQFIHLLNHLIPPEYQTTKNNFTKIIDQYVIEQSSQYHNQRSIEAFLSERNLLTMAINPDANDGNTSMSSSSIQRKFNLSDEVWNNIQEIQQKGGYEYLLNDMKGLDAKSNEINELLQSIGNTLFKDDAENNKYRVLYGSDWIIGSNDTYTKEVSDAKNELASLDNQKMQAQNSIMDNSFLFSLLALPKNQIEAQLPNHYGADLSGNGNDNNQLGSLSSTEEGNKLKGSLSDLAKEQEKLNDVNKKISMISNTPLSIDQLKKLKGNYSAEKALAEERKKSFGKIFMELEAVHKSIQAVLEKVEEDYQQWKNKMQQLSPKKKYSNTICEFNVNPMVNIKLIYNDALYSLSTLKTSYSSLSCKVIRLNDDAEGFLFAKNFQKEDLIKRLDSKARRNLAQSKPGK